MKIYVPTLLALLTIAGISKAVGQEKYDKQLPMVHMAGLLRLVETIPLPTEGWMDHLTVDLKNQHLFISGEEQQKFCSRGPARGQSNPRDQRVGRKSPQAVL